MTKQPHTTLNYPGDQSAMEHPTFLGPTTMGEVLYTVSAEYDAETNRTKVGLRYDLAEMMSEMQEAAEA